MSKSRPKTIRPERRIRYLKLIALYEILKGFLLLVVGISLIFLNSRTQLLDRIGEWAGDELAVVHSRAALYFLNGLQDVVSSGRLRFTGMVSLFYAVVLFVEGAGVYLQQRWAELLVVLATAFLIPFEAYHFWRHPRAVPALVLAANCLIVWFLYRVLQRERREALPVAKPTVVEVR